MAALAQLRQYLPLEQPCSLRRGIQEDAIEDMACLVGAGACSSGACSGILQEAVGKTVWLLQVCVRSALAGLGGGVGLD